MHSIFDATFGGITRGEMYQGWVDPTIVPDQPQPVLSNWHPEDLAAYCGGSYTTN